ncbi:hypothetical protein I6N96_01020 [Enterococcus sp. BWM-S5]|uniref:Uncharacterized protein n=1 Tax=Enterococcus larvae TaxID=2794352 RepID=A0ABS4CF51_9ENTE|nr:hypothetical protein [Enterococcus larvae]MBP1044843.1 hypothetical protein [Enterococcus larvae]
MEKYGWLPERIDKEDYFQMLDLEFGNWQQGMTDGPVIEYADQLNF